MSKIEIYSFSIPVTSDEYVEGDTSIAFGSSLEAANSSRRIMVDVIPSHFKSPEYNSTYEIFPVPSNSMFYIVKEIDHSKERSAHSKNDIEKERDRKYNESIVRLENQPNMYLDSPKWEKK